MMNELLLLGSLSFQLFYSWKQYHFFCFQKKEKRKKRIRANQASEVQVLKAGVPESRQASTHKPATL